MAAATLARGADAGAAVGLVLLATTAAHLDRPGLIGGLLVAALTAPHLLGPVLARQLDRARDGRTLLAAITAGYGVAIGAATLLFGAVPIGVSVLLVILAGLCGPILTGGLSSRLASLVAADDRVQRRAQGWDALSYGVGGTAGPAAVAALSGVFGARAALIVLAGCAIAAAALIRTLPPNSGQAIPVDDVLPVRRTLRLIATIGPLRRVMYATMAASLPAGAIAVMAVALGHDLRISAQSAALLAAAFGLGNLAGSLLMTVRPLLGEPERLVSASMAAVGVAYLACSAAPTYGLALAGFGLVGVLNAPMFTATLAARAGYSPPEARAQVFVSMAALKVAASAVGTAAAGAALGLGPRVLLAIGASAILATAAATVLDRRVHPGR